jgi:hypothetical protein
MGLWVFLAACLAVLPLASVSSAFAAPPKELQDSGDCGIPASQKANFDAVSGNKYFLRSWFEPGGILPSVVSEVIKSNRSQMKPSALRQTAATRSACAHW